MLLAARALSEETRGQALILDGRTLQGDGAHPIDAGVLAMRGLDLVNSGDTPVDVLVSIIGTSLTPEPATSKGFTITRSYYTLDGQKVEMKSAEGGTGSLAQNDRLLVVLTVEGAEAGGRVMLVDRLPAGLEIENPRLVEGGDLKGLDWLQRPREPQHTEFRDDRFVAAFDFFGERQRGDGTGPDVASKATVAYIVRAVSAGSFVHPAATVEDMYRPDRFARTAAGRLDIEPRK